MTKRQELIRFARSSGLEIKGDSQRIVTAFNPKNNWVDCFDSWDQAHAFFQAAIIAYRDQLTPHPWAK